MSVIFPLETEVSKRCLNCREGWNLANVGEVTWCVKQQQADQFLLGGFNANVYFCHSRCGLWVKIDDSYDGEADPITKLALDTIQASGEVQSSPETSQKTRDVSGFRKLVEDFLSETKKAYPDDVSGDVSPEARRAIRARFPQSETPTLLKIPRWEFRRIRLCSPKWPEVSIPAPLSRAKGLLEETMKGVNRLQELLSTCPDTPFGAVEWIIGASYHRKTGYRIKLLKSVQQLHKRRRRSDRVHTMTRYLEHYSQAAQQLSNPFEPEALRTRCLLWTVSEMRRLEEKLITLCAYSIQNSDIWIQPEYIRRKSSLFEKLITFPHIILLPIWKCTFDVIRDVGEAASNMLRPDGPPVSLAALCAVIADSESLSFDRVLDGNCGNSHYGMLKLDHYYFHNALAPGMDPQVLRGWETRYRDALEKFTTLAIA